MTKNFKKKANEIKKLEDTIQKEQKMLQFIDEKEKNSEDEIVSTCDTPKISLKNISKTNKILIYKRSNLRLKSEQIIGKAMGLEIDESTVNIKSFYDEEIRDKLIKRILAEKVTFIKGSNHRKESFCSLCTSRSEKLYNDDSESTKDDDFKCVII